MRKYISLTMMFALVLIFGCNSSVRKQPTDRATKTQSVTMNSIIVYGRTTCAFCKQLMSELDAQNVSYKFLNISQVANKQKMVTILQEKGISGSIELPVVKVGQNVLLRPSVYDIKRLN